LIFKGICGKVLNIAKHAIPPTLRYMGVRVGVPYPT